MIWTRVWIAAVLSMAMGVIVVTGAAAVAPDITAFTGPATDVVSAITTAVPTLLAAVGVIIAGMLAFRVGVRILRSFAK